MLIDAPGGLDLNMVLHGEQRLQPRGLLLGEQVVTGVQGPPGPVQRVVCPAAVAVQVLLDPAAARIQGISGQADDVEGYVDVVGIGAGEGGGPADEVGIIQRFWRKASRLSSWGW